MTNGAEIEQPIVGAPRGAGGLVRRLFHMRETGLILIILALFVVMSLASPYFLTWVNIRAMVMAFAVEGIVVVGMTILLISGGIDLSVGSVTALSMVIAGWLFLNGVDPWNRRKVAGLMKAIAPVAEAHDATPAQTVIAWTLAQPGITFSLCGSRNATQARENAAAGRLRLTSEELDEISGAAASRLSNMNN